MTPINVQSSEEFISALAAKIAAQPLHFSDPDVRGVPTAICEKIQKRNKELRKLMEKEVVTVESLQSENRA